MIGQRSAKLGADAPKLRSHQVMNQDTDQRLRAYVLAAGSAGVGLLAAAQPAKAQVVYAPSNTTISDGALFIDLNCGPKVHFWLANRAEASSYGDFRELELNGSVNASVIVNSNGPAQLAQGETIGSSRSFQTVHKNEQILGSAYWFSYYFAYSGFIGNWANNQPGYLGLKFNINGQTHYGWAELQLRGEAQGPAVQRIDATLLGYAYEVSPDTPIQAGARRVEGDSLQALARGKTQNSPGTCPDYEPHNPLHRKLPPKK